MLMPKNDVEGELIETDASKYPLLQKRLEQHGYTLYKIVHFKNFDRIHFGNSAIKISLNLRGKLSKFTLDTLIEACIGKEAKS
jgi:hypothetical protein